MIGMTRRQSDCLDFIKAFILENGIPPSVKEMKENLRLNSTSGVHRIVRALEERHLIRRVPRRARAIEVVGADNRRAILLNHEVYAVLAAYADAQGIGMDTAANELLREGLGLA